MVTATYVRTGFIVWETQIDLWEWRWICGGDLNVVLTQSNIRTIVTLSIIWVRQTNRDLSVWTEVHRPSFTSRVRVTLNPKS